MNPQLLQLAIARHERTEHGYKQHEDGYVMTDAQQGVMVNALGLQKGKDYRPYCLRCDLMPRVAVRPFGFECWNCHITFGFDLIACDPFKPTPVFLPVEPLPSHDTPQSSQAEPSADHPTAEHAHP